MIQSHEPEATKFHIKHEFPTSLEISISLKTVSNEIFYANYILQTCFSAIFIVPNFFGCGDHNYLIALNRGKLSVSNGRKILTPNFLSNNACASISALKEKQIRKKHRIHSIQIRRAPKQTK
jgi:hypothetical protein